MDHKAHQLPATFHFLRDQDGKVKLLNQPRLLPNFDPNGQTWKLFLGQLPRMVLTVLFLGAYVATVLIYQAKEPVDRGEKRVFDGVTTGLLLGLGLNFFEVFKDMAKTIRWSILSSWYFEVRDVDLIWGAESLLKVLQLMMRSPPKSLVFLTCLVWLLVNVGAQISVATLPLFVTLKGGFNSSGITISHGDVSVPKLDHFYPSGMTEPVEHSDRLDGPAAHTYGESGGAFRTENCSYHGIDDINNSPQSCPYLIREDRREFAIRYADSNPADLTHAYPYYGAGRIVTTAATDCVKYTPPSPTNVDSTDGPNSVAVWQFENSTGAYTLEIPRTSLADYSTTYIWNDINSPRGAKLHACGQRCVIMYALRNIPKRDRSILQCRIAISPVSNTKHDAHVLSDDIARTAAASIALTGRWRMTNGDYDWRQFQLYQEGAKWASKVEDSPEDVGALMAEFAASTLATMALQNPTTLVPGDKPELGYLTDVEWGSAVGFIASIAATHLLLVLLILYLARPVVVVDDSYLVMARLLKGLVENVPEGDELRLSQGKELARDLASVIKAGPGPAMEKAEESRPLLKVSPLPSARNLDDDMGTTLGDDAAKDDSLSETEDQGLSGGALHQVL